MKAMAARPEDRYAGPKTLAEDIERWMADEPVKVYPEPPLNRLARWLRRNSHLAAIAAVFTITAIVALSIDDLGFSGINIIDVVLTILAAALGLLLLLVSLELIRTRRRLAQAQSKARGSER
jgi:hypothetical protein